MKAARAITTTPPTTIPAIAPPPRLEPPEDGAGVGVGVELEVGNPSEGRGSPGEISIVEFSAKASWTS